MSFPIRTMPLSYLAGMLLWWLVVSEHLLHSFGDSFSTFTKQQYLEMAKKIPTSACPCTRPSGIFAWEALFTEPLPQNHNPAYTVKCMSYVKELAFDTIYADPIHNIKLEDTFQEADGTYDTGDGFYSR